MKLQNLTGGKEREGVTSQKSTGIKKSMWRIPQNGIVLRRDAVSRGKREKRGGGRGVPTSVLSNL